jgi:hypothetical protein
MKKIDVSEVLTRAGLTPEGISAFTNANKTMIKNLGKFETALRARKYPVADGLLIGLNLRQDEDWDKFDDLTILHLSLWFISVYDPTATSFDWDTAFTAPIFHAFEEGLSTASFSEPDDSQTTQMKPSAPNVHTPDVPIPATDKSAHNGLFPPPANSDSDSAYSHIYHYDVLRADKTDHRRRTGTDDDTNIPTPHPLWQSADIAKAVDINIKEFLNMTLAPLLSSEPEAIREFYRSLTRQATASNIDLCPLDYYEQAYALWPKNLPAPIVLNMSRFLLLKLEQHDAINRKDAVLKLLYTKHITLGNSKLSAYHFLHALLQLAQDAQTGSLVTLPRYKDTMDVVMFAEKLLWYCHNELSKSRSYTQRELSKHYLQELDLHGFLVQVQLTALDDVPPDDEIPFSLRYAQLAIHFAPPANIVDVPGMPQAHRLGNAERNTPSTKGRPSRDNSRDGPFRQFEDVQCKACSIWGHSVKNCSGLAKIATVHEYITAHPAHASTAVKTWRELHIENHRTNTKAHSLHAIPGTTPETLPLDELDLADLYQADFQ